jgi:hypothetical protein
MQEGSFGVKSSHTVSPSPGLPITRNLTLVYVFSLVVALLMTVASAAGLLYPARFYPTEELQQSFVANDVVNLVLVLPILLGSMWFARRGELLGLLFWPGALFVVFYNAVAYVFALPQNVSFLLNLGLVTTSAYTTISLVASIDGDVVQRRLKGAVSERVAGGILAGLGGLFLLLVVSTVGGALINQTPIPEADLGVQVADSFAVPAWIIGGILLWRRRPLGYVAGAGLLFQASMLFVGVIGFLFLQPLLTAMPFALNDVIVLSIMGLICFVPFGLFVRGVVSRRE